MTVPGSNLQECRAEAERLAPGPALAREVHRALADLRARLAARDWDAFCAVTAPRLRWLERVYAHRPGAKEAEIRQFCAQSGANPGFALEPLDPARYDLRVVAGGRLVACVDRDGRALLREPPNAQGHVTTWDVLFGRLPGGAWRVLL